MSVPKILRNEHEYDMPVYFQGRSLRFQHSFSSYYLNDTGISKAGLRATFLKTFSRRQGSPSPRKNRLTGLGPGRKNKGLPTILESELCRTEETATGSSHRSPTICSNLTLDPSSARRQSNALRVDSQLRTDSCRKRSRLRVGARRYASTRRISVMDLGQVHSVADLISADRPNVTVTDENKKSILDSLRQPRFADTGPRVPYSSVSDLVALERKAENPLQILDKFEKLTAINIQNVARMVDGKEKLQLSSKDIYVDMYTYNETCRPRIPALRIPLPSRQAARIHPVPPQKDPEPKPNTGPDQIIPIIPVARSKSLPRLRPVAADLQAKSPAPAVVSAAISKKISRKRDRGNRPAEIRQLFMEVEERTKRTKAIRGTCKKYAREVTRQQFDARREKELMQDLATQQRMLEAPSDELRRSRSRNLPERYRKAEEEVLARSFNAERRYNVDNAKLQKYREDLYKDYKDMERGLKSIEGDRFATKNNRIRTDLIISRMIYNEKKRMKMNSLAS